MRCEEVRLDLVAFLRRELNEAQNRELQEHLASCLDCTGEKNAFEEMLDLVREAQLNERPSADLKMAALAAVETVELSALLSRSWSVAPPPDLKERAISRALEARPGVVARLPRRPASTWIAAAAAFVGIGLAFGSQAQVQTIGRELDQARSAQQTIGKELDQARSVQQRAIDQLGPVGHELQDVQLAGAQASATAKLVHFSHDNYRVSVTLQHLEPTPTNHRYEVWMKGPRGETTIGSFRLIRPDHLRTSFSMGVDPGDFPELLITLEPNDGDPAMSNTILARATLDRDSMYHGVYDE